MTEVMNNPYTLYELSEKVQALDEILDLLTDPDSSWSDEEREQLEEAYTNAFDELGESESAKIDAYATLQQVWEAVAANCKAETQRLSARRKVFENKVARNKDRLIWYMRGLDKKKIEGIRFTASLVKPRVTVVIDDEYALPEGTYEVVPSIKPDRTEIKRRLDAGEDVPGAHLEDGNWSVRIK